MWGGRLRGPTGLTNYEDPSRDVFLMLEEIKSSARLNGSAERSALVADALRGGGLFEGVRPSVRLKVYGESMLPALWPGDVVEVANCSIDDLLPGDIVLAMRDGRLFLHRFVATQPGGFVLRGDSVPGPDPAFPPEALLGRLVRDGHEKQDVAGPRRRPRFGARWLSAKWSRVAGLLLCYCSVGRRLALRLHMRGKTTGSDLRKSEPAGALASLELNSAGLDVTEAGTC